jgi:predicted N-acetyltransferase YhbS
MSEGRIGYDRVTRLAAREVADLYAACSLGARRPIDDLARLQRMFDHASLIITARDGNALVGVARSLSDFSFCTYLADLAVRESHQRHGIGRELVRLTREAGGTNTLLTLLSAPGAESYYPALGLHPHDSAWVLLPGETLTSTPSPSSP